MNRPGPVRGPIPGPVTVGLTGLHVAALLGAVGIGAWVAIGVPWPPCALVAAIAWQRGRPWVLCGALALSASGLAAAADAGLAVPAGRFTGTVTAVRDARVSARGPVVEVRITDGVATADPDPTARDAAPIDAAAYHAKHFDLLGDRRTEAVLRAVRAGDHLDVEATVSPVSDRSFLRWRHVAGRLRATRATGRGSSAWWWRAANGVRSVVGTLGAPLSDRSRALFDGFVLGDASGQDALARADFQGAGLTHLLVASGANVAMVLALAAPVLRRCRIGVRVALTMVLLVGFVTITRFEPSVLRAAVMAAIAAGGAGLGRLGDARRTLGIAIIALVLIDPFLVHSVAFGLSVAASLGVIVLARPIAATLPGPELVRTPMAVTLAAQLGVSPLLVSVFGGLPVATIPANVLAAPAAGLVVALGLPCLAIATTGLPGAGLLVMVPEALLGWIAAVARHAAAAPLGWLDATGVAAGSLCLGVAIAGRWVGADRVRRLALCAALLGALAPGVSGALATGVHDPAEGVHVVRTRSTTVVVLTRAVAPDDALDALARAGVRRIDLLVAPHGDDADRAVHRALVHRFSVGAVAVPPTADWTGAQVMRRGERLRVGDVAIGVILDRPVLAVEATPIEPAREPQRGSPRGDPD